jgi:hypothetical protein
MDKPRGPCPARDFVLMIFENEGAMNSSRIIRAYRCDKRCGEAIRLNTMH